MGKFKASKKRTIKPEELSKLISFIIEAHENHAKMSYKKVRIWDLKTPYSVHPIWAAMMLLQEPLLDEKIRKNGCQALLLHDILENTTAELPKWITPAVRKLVNELTFTENKEIREKIWGHSDTAILLHLYDATSNVLDGAWVTDKEKTRNRRNHLIKLANFVEKKFGRLNIVVLAETLCKNKK